MPSLHPVQPHEFFSTYWKKFHHLQRSIVQQGIQLRSIETGRLVGNNEPRGVLPWFAEKRLVVNPNIIIRLEIQRPHHHALCFEPQLTLEACMEDPEHDDTDTEGDDLWTIQVDYHQTVPRKGAWVIQRVDWNLDPYRGPLPDIGLKKTANKEIPETEALKAAAVLVSFYSSLAA